MSDYLVRMVARDIGVRAVACITTEVVEESISRHRAGSGASYMLAQMLTGAALLGAMLKIGQRLAIKVQGDGPLQKLIVESDANGNVRGYVAQPKIVLPADIQREDAAATIGPNGLVHVIKDLRLEEPVEGIVPLTRSTVAANLADYLQFSEQIPSLVNIGIAVDEAGAIRRSGGLLLQALPPYDGSIFAQLQEKLEELPPMDMLIATGHTPEEIVDLILAGRDRKTLVTQPLSFSCSCSQERTRQALISIGKEEVSQILTTEGKAIIDCNFCGAQYIFSGAELEALLAEM